MRRHVEVVAVVSGLLALAVGSAIAGTTTKPAQRPTSVYIDQVAGDAVGSGPDLVEASVQSLSGDRLRFYVLIANRQKAADAGDIYFLEINSDRNRSTGQPASDSTKSGTDYQIVYSANNNSVGLGHFVTANGTTSVVGVNTGSSMASTFSGGAQLTWVVTLSKALLGDPQSFTFYVGGNAGSGASADFIPDRGAGVDAYPAPASKPGVPNASGLTFKVLDGTVVAGRTSKVVVVARHNGTQEGSGLFNCLAFAPNGESIGAGPVKIKANAELSCPIKVPVSAKHKVITVAFVFTFSGSPEIWQDYLTAH